MFDPPPRGAHGYDRPRRYPPTPYAPHSKETEDYRVGWDHGWNFANKRGAKAALMQWIQNGYWVNQAPVHVGFEHGVKAWIDWRTRRIRRDQQRDQK